MANVPRKASGTNTTGTCTRRGWAGSPMSVRISMWSTTTGHDRRIAKISLAASVVGQTIRLSIRGGSSVRRIVSLCALAVPAALLVACGGDNSSSTSATTTPTTAAATTAAPTTTPPPPPPPPPRGGRRGPPPPPPPPAAPPATTATTAAATTAAGAATTAAAAAQSVCKPVGDINSAANKLSYNLTEFKFDGPATSKGGQVGFALTNSGQAPHELKIIKADNDDALPKDAVGGVDEKALPAGALVGTVPRFAAGSNCSGVFDLAPGNYVLVCNVEFKNGPTTVSHFAKGMYLNFQVTA